VPTALFSWSKRCFAVLAGFALLGLGCRHSTTTAVAAVPRNLSGAAKSWNVIFLTIDTVRADHLGSYGYRSHATSPAIDRQLAKGAIFENSFSQRAATWPSLASLLTGLYPTAHGVDENGFGFPDDTPTMPKILHAAGYRTAAFLSNMCDANHRGWDEFACEGGKDGPTVQNALNWAARPAADLRPFLLWVHLFGAHNPYYNGGDAAARVLDPGYKGELGPKKWRLNEVMTKRIPLDVADLRHLNALYDAALMGTDNQVNRLINGLSEAGRLNHTLFVLTADHGEELYAHNGYIYHACSVYQTTLHVPLGMSAPGLLDQRRLPQTVELIDVLPTVLDLVGVSPPREIQGRSLVPYFERTAPGGAGKPAFSEYGLSGIHTVVHDGWKLVDNPTRYDPVCIPGAPPHHFPIGRSELYNLATDPQEQRNLAAQEPAKVTELTRLIQQRFTGMTQRAKPQQIPDRLRKELESLGYVH
jgi:choline-sulfatase